jgi:hypothetical protein
MKAKECSLSSPRAPCGFVMPASLAVFKEGKLRSRHPPTNEPYYKYGFDGAKMMADALASSSSDSSPT